MATGKSYFSKPSYRFLNGDNQRDSSSSLMMNSEIPMFEFDESDIWNNNNNNTSNHHHHQQQVLSSSKSMKGSSRMKRSSSKVVPNGGSSLMNGASSLPVNIPDWSKILREERSSNYQRNENDDDDDYDYEGGGGVGSCKIPPHEFLAKQFARTKIASFSVHEGVGRTLKGRDLSRVRDAIWEKTGFED